MYIVLHYPCAIVIHFFIRNHRGIYATSVDTTEFVYFGYRLSLLHWLNMGIGTVAIRPHYIHNMGYHLLNHCLCLMKIWGN